MEFFPPSGKPGAGGLRRRAGDTTMPRRAVEADGMVVVVAALRQIARVAARQVHLQSDQPFQSHVTPRSRLAMNSLCEKLLAMPLEFRLSTSQETSQTYALLRDRFHWLQARGLSHDGLTAFSEVVLRQQRQENFVLVETGQIVGTICVQQDLTHPEDTPWVPQGIHWWLFSLATHPTAAGRNLGGRILRLALEHLKSKQTDVVFLDCLDGNGFLPRFYRAQGFAFLGRKWVDQGGAQLVPMSVFSVSTSAWPVTS